MKNERDIFQINGLIKSKGRRLLRRAIFTVKADDRDDAKFLFAHGVCHAAIKATQEIVSLDFRTVKKAGK